MVDLEEYADTFRKIMPKRIETARRFTELKIQKDEKLQNKGAQELTDAEIGELLQIIGTYDTSSVSLRGSMRKVKHGLEKVSSSWLKLANKEAALIKDRREFKTALATIGKYRIDLDEQLRVATRLHNHLESVYAKQVHVLASSHPLDWKFASYIKLVKEENDIRTNSEHFFESALRINKSFAGFTFSHQEVIAYIRKLTILSGLTAGATMLLYAGGLVRFQQGNHDLNETLIATILSVVIVPLGIALAIKVKDHIPEQPLPQA